MPPVTRHVLIVGVGIVGTALRLCATTRDISVSGSVNT